MPRPRALRFPPRLALLLAATLPCPAYADFIIGDFEAGLDPFLVPVGTFNGSVPDNATRGTSAGSFNSAVGWGPYVRYDNGNKAAGNLAGELAYYNDIAFDINVPAPNPEAYFINVIVFNASVFGWTQSDELLPAGGADKDIKGLGTVTMTWPYRQAIQDFDNKLAQFMADPGAYFQALLISNHGGPWDSTAFYLDNWRLKRYLGDANEDGVVSGDDYALIDRGIASGLTGWENGDFNLDNSINAADYLLIDKGLAHQNGALSPELLAARANTFGDAYVSELLGAIPEPSLAVCGLGIVPLVRRRSR